MLKQWIALNACANWLVKFRISCAIYLQTTQKKKMASQFASVEGEEIIPINFYGVYYVTVLVYTKTTVNLRVGG